MKKTVKNISLVLSGVVLGVAISFSGEISAATSKLLGGKVGKVMTVTLNDKSIGEAPVIGGTSYVPVRTAANELGLEVKVSGNEIELSSPASVVADNSDQINAKKDEITRQINTVNVEIRNAQNVVDKKDAILRRIDSDTEYLKKMEESQARGSDFYSDELIESTKEGIANSKKILEDAEKNLPVLKEKLAGLESQMAALDK